jgi:hypothetical protein
MIPDPAAALQGMTATLLMDIAPSLGEEYKKASANLLAFAALVIAAELDRAAHVRVAENREMRRIFAAADTASAGDANLRERLRAAARGSDDDLRVSALTATNDQLRRLLIELHAAAEQEDTSPARDLCRQIWCFLRDAAERRAIQLG